VAAARYIPPDRKAANVALHGEIKVNGVIIGGWYARRVDPIVDEDAVHLYACRYFEETTLDGGWADSWSMEFTVEHRYSDGAAELARKVLTAGEGGW
jgi:hypothetical protein